MGIRRVDDPQHPRGYREIRSNAEMRKLMDRKIVTQNQSRITATSFQTTLIRAEWEERGGTIIPTTSRQFTGGATERRDPAACDKTLRMFLGELDLARRNSRYRVYQSQIALRGDA
jgi:hypothetical protein